MLCAIVQESVVVQISNLSEDDIQKISPNYGAIVDVTDINPKPQIGWILSGNVLIPGAGQTSEPIWKITRLAMRQRFTFTELCALTSFASGAGSNNIAVAVLMDNLRVASYIDLKRTDTAGGVNLLVSIGLITSDRANAILNTPPTNSEVYKE